MSNADIESPTPSPPTLTAMAATLYRGGSGYREGYIADLEANDNESEVSDVVIEDDEGGGVYVIYSDGEGRVPNAYYSSQGHLPPEAPGFFGSLFGRAGDAFKRNFLSSVSPLPYSLSVLLSDLKAAATVSLVSLPLSIALSIAGGGLPAQGIISAFWAGTFAAALGGSEWNIVGPTGALSGLLMALSVCCGGPGVLPLLAIEAALMVFAVWALDLAKYLMFIPSAVIEGFTAGVAAIIIFGQLDSAVGLVIKHEEKEFLWKTIESFQHFLEWKWQVGVFYLVNVTFLLVLTRRIRTVPWHMVFTAIGILVGWLSSTDRIPFHPRTLFDTYGAIPLTLIQFPNFDPNLFLNSTLFKSAFGTAFIAILETLISARMADEMTRKTDHVQSREVFGLAAANLASGIFGGVPATAALARTSLNVRSGARTRLSALLAPLCLLVISFGLLDLFRFVPMVTIASVLTVVGINMIDFGHFKHLWELDRFMFGVGILTAIVCIVEDTMMGLVVGSLISMLAFSGEVAVGHCEMLLTEGKNPVAFIDVAKLDAQKLTRIKLVGPAILAFQQQNPFPAVHSRTWSSSGSEAAPSRIPSSDDRRLLAQGPITYGSIESGAVASPTTPTVTTPLLAPDSVTVAVSGPPVLRVRTPGGSKSGKQIPPTLPLRAYNASTADRTPIIGRRPSIYPAGPDENRRPLSTDYKADTLIYHFAGSLTYINASSHLTRHKKLVAHGLPPVLTAIIFVFRSVGEIDHDGIDALREIFALYRKHVPNLLVFLTGLVHEETRGKLEKHGWFEEKVEKGRVLESWAAALDAIEMMQPRRN